MLVIVCVCETVMTVRDGHTAVMEFTHRERVS